MTIKSWVRQCPGRVIHVLAGKSEARREDCAPVAGKSTLSRLELSRETTTRYHKIGMIRRPLTVCHAVPGGAQGPKEFILDLDATDDPLHEHQEGRSLMAIMHSPRSPQPSSTPSQLPVRIHAPITTLMVSSRERETRLTRGQPQRRSPRHRPEAAQTFQRANPLPAKKG